jgi:Xaa-Pro aminopeptidase
VPLAIPDAFLYVERNGDRHLVASSFELDRVAAVAPELDALPYEEFGIDELYAQGLSREEIELEVILRAARRFGVEQAIVPSTFPLAVADHLRANGIEVTADRQHFVGRRRVKNDAELAGIRRAQRAAEAAMDAARELLRSAERQNGSLLLHGSQSAVGHDMGSGPIAPDEPICLDLFPRDRDSGCFADMTRVFVVGTPSDELLEWHKLCKEALDRSVAAAKPGIPGTDLYKITCDVFEEHGYPTLRSKEPGEVLQDGFYHSLGHGVGLEVHEEPTLGRSPGELVAGDVIAVEPGLYRHGYGGCRLEDLVLVTENGPEVLTDYPYDLEP